jgi:hypothetical protein
MIWKLYTGFISVVSLEILYDSNKPNRAGCVPHLTMEAELASKLRSWSVIDYIHLWKKPYTDQIFTWVWKKDQLPKHHACIVTKYTIFITFNYKNFFIPPNNFTGEGSLRNSFVLNGFAVLMRQFLRLCYMAGRRIEVMQVHLRDHSHYKFGM